MQDLDAIKARIEISGLKGRHLRQLDTKDWAGYAALLAENFELDISDRTGIPPIHGRDAAMKLIQGSIGAVTTVHQAHPAEFEIQNDEVLAVWPMHDRIVRGPEQPSNSGYGHHHDRWVLRNGEWKLASQKLTRLHVDTLPPATALPRGNAPAAPQSLKVNDLQAISAWMDLNQAMARFCRALDTKDWAGYANLMTDDYVLDVSEGSNIPVVHGRDAALKQIQSSILTATTAHQIHTPEIEIKGDEARVIWAMQDRVLWGADRPSLTGYGHYHQRWVRQNGQWKLAEQKLTRLHLDFQMPQTAV